MRHTPVMLSEALEMLALRPESVVLDATLGLGGHAAAIAQRLESGLLIACDRDPESIEIARRNTAVWADRICYRVAKFSELSAVLTQLGVARVDGLLADLGASMYQLTSPERGFSLLYDGPLDCRMNRSEGRPAADLVNSLPEKALADLIFQFGQERRSRRIAGALVRARPIRNTLELARVVESAVPRTGRIHPATRVMMALRIATNDEFGELEALLAALPDLLRPQGRAVVISFHSGEDSRVKHSFNALARQGRARLLTKHVLRPTREEVRENPASRGAKLRALEIL